MIKICCNTLKYNKPSSWVATTVCIYAKSIRYGFIGRPGYITACMREGDILHSRRGGRSRVVTTAGFLPACSPKPTAVFTFTTTLVQLLLLYYCMIQLYGTVAMYLCPKAGGASSREYTIFNIRHSEGAVTYRPTHQNKQKLGP